jgi:hypothetical protein
MRTFYFPESLYVEAHTDYLNKTGKDPQKVLEYSLQNLEFFVEVVFSYVDGLPYPEMKEPA